MRDFIERETAQISVRPSEYLNKQRHSLSISTLFTPFNFFCYVRGEEREIDINRDVRREIRRPNTNINNNKQHKFVLVSGSSSVEDSRREKIRQLSTFPKMGSIGSEPNPRKFKLPKKNFGDYSSTVPRKLRSAIRKRSCESTSVPLPDPKRLSRLVNNVEPLRKDCLNKSKISTNEHSSKRAASVSISKDEVEVAETLFALAGMIPLSNIHMKDKDKLDGGLLEAKVSELEEKHKDSMLEHKDPVTLKEVPEATCHPPSSEEASANLTPNKSPSDSEQEKPRIEPAPLSWPNLSERRQLNPNLQVSVPPLNLQTISPLLRTCDQRSWLDSTLFQSSTEPNRESRLGEIKQEKALLGNGGSHIETRAVNVGAIQETQHATTIERTNEGLTSKALHGSTVDELLPQASGSGIVFLPLPNAATASSKLGTPENPVSADKVSINGRGKSWKKCAAHVYISHLIQGMQNSEGKDIQPLDNGQLRPSQCFAGGLVPSDHSNTARIDVNGLLTASRMYGSAAYKNAREATNAMSMNHRQNFEQEQQRHSLSGCSGSKKQSFEFMSLSAGTSSAADNGANKTGNTLETAARSHVLYMHSVAQHGSSVPFTMPKHQLPSNSYRDQVSAISGPLSAAPQVSLQVPPYFGNHFGPAHTSSTTPTAQQLQQNQQQQQMWTAQLAARFRPGPLLSSHIANWQNRTQGLQPSTNHIQALLPPSQPSLEALGAKYLNISQQQPQLIGLAPLLPPARTKPQHGQSLREDNGVRFRPDGVLPLQLLCNERH